MLRCAGVVVLLAAISITYYRTLENGFVYDDTVQVVDNHWIKDVKYLPEIFTSHTFGYESEKCMSRTYRPVFLSIFTAEYALFGLDPSGWHLTNIILHAINTVLVFLLLRKLLSGGLAKAPAAFTIGTDLPPFFAALIFAVHPASGEVVNWVSCMPELAYTLLCLVSFYLYMESREGRPFLMRTLSVASFFLALLTKEPALSLPAILIFYDYTREENGLKGMLRAASIKRYLPYAAAVIVFFLMRMHALGRLVVPREQMYQYLTAPQQFYNASVLLARYLKTLLSPLYYYPFQIFTPFTSALEPEVYLSITALVVLFAAAFMLRNRADKLYITALAFIVLPLLPALYIPGIMHHSFAYRYLYLPLVGFALLLSILMRAAAARKKILLASILAFYMITASTVYAISGIKGAADWKNEFSIWRASLKGSPGTNFYAMYSLGNEYSRTDSHGEAIRWYRDAEKALKESPHSDRAAILNVLMELGRTYTSAGMPEEALGVYGELTANYPNNPAVFLYAGYAYENANLLEEAVSSYKKAAGLSGNASALEVIYFDLGRTYLKKGEFEEALNCYEEILRISPGNAEARKNIAAVLARTGNGIK
ncbi:MAG: tetratricopeptide repeat protein [Deltaproteobacteria bacterium]|nr:tetratricopeptide repeat protein [Deltaproteobacteria bacterium]